MWLLNCGFATAALVLVGAYLPLERYWLAAGWAALAIGNVWLASEQASFGRAFTAWLIMFNVTVAVIALAILWASRVELRNLEERKP